MMTLRQADVSNHFCRVTAGDPSAIFFVNRLLCPVVTLSALTVSLLINHEVFSGPYFIVAFLAVIGVTDFLNLPKVSGRQSAFTALRFLLDVSLRWFVVFGMILGLLYCSGITERLNLDVLRTWVVAAPIFLWGGELAALHWGLRQIPPRRAVVIGFTDLGVRLKSYLTQDPLMCTTVFGFFEDRNPDRLPKDSQGSILGRSDQMLEYILANEIDIVYITLPMTRHPRIMKLLELLRDSTVSIYFVPDLFVFNLVQSRVDRIHDIPVISVRESPFYGMHGVSKRICDLIISVIATCLIAPVLLAIAIGVKVSSPGPILFKQRRHGLDGEAIIVYKFRSMTVTEDGEKSYTQVTRNDARVTRFGAILRKLSLDELPQLFNVIEGSMSIVGPRPHAVAVNETYRRLIPSYMVRHKVKPGITGLAQVNGYRGGDDLDSMTKRVNMDLTYLSQWSLRLDLLIILKTAVMIWTDRSAY